MPYETADWIHLENPEYSDEDFRKTEAGKVNVVGTINLGRGIQARLALLKGPGDETGIYVYLFSRREPYNWTMEKATEWLQAHLAKQGVFSFNYLASVEVYNPMKHLAKIKILDTTVNSNRWQVTDEALKRALDTLIGRPLIAYPDHSGDVVAGLFVDAQKPDGYAVGIAEILDLDSWEKIMRGEWRFVSPKVTAYAVSKRNGVDIIEDFEFEHVAFVPRGAYPSAQVLSTYAGEESSLRSFSAALTEELEKIKKGEDWKMSENAHDKELAEAKATIEKLEAANKNLRELLEQKTKTPYEAEITELKGQLEKRDADVKKLQESLGRFEAERHSAKVQNLLNLRANLGFVPTNEDLTRFQAMTDDILDQLIEDTKDLVDRGSYQATPKAKYLGGHSLDAVERERLRICGYSRDAEGKIVGGN